MENEILPKGCYRIIIADLNDKRIIVDERTVCIVGAFTTLDDNTGEKCSANCMFFSKYTTGVALFTAESAEEAAIKMKTSVRKAEHRKFWEKIKNLFKKTEE